MGPTFGGVALVAEEVVFRGSIFQNRLDGAFPGIEADEIHGPQVAEAR